MAILTPTRVPIPTSAVSRRSPTRRLAVVQLLATVVDGVALSTIVLHVTAHLGLAPATTGAVLAVAATAALVLAGPLGAVADRVGLRRTGAVATAASALALLGYALADSAPAYALSAVTFVVAQAVAGSVRQALAVTGVPAADRLRVRAAMHTLLNAGIGAGTVIGAGLAALGTGEAFRTAYLAAGLVSLVGAAVTLRLPVHGEHRVSPAPRERGGLRLVAHDRRFLLATALAALVQLTMPVLSVLLPAWVLQHTSAPAWTAGAALAVNTVMVILTQRAATARLRDPRAVVTAALLAGAALFGTGVLLAASGATRSPYVALTLVGLAAVALTCGEVAGGSATWAVALRDVPPDAEGRYQAVFSMSASAARIVGPAVALPLVLAFPGPGWIGLGAVMALACAGIGRLAR